MRERLQAVSGLHEAGEGVSLRQRLLADAQAFEALGMAKVAAELRRRALLMKADQ